MRASIPLADRVDPRLRFPLVLALPVLALGAACASTYAPRLVDGQTARIDIMPVTPRESRNPGERPETFEVAVHDFANGCPLVEDHRTGKGYRGTLTAKVDSPLSVVVPSGKRLVLTRVTESSTPYRLFGLLGEALAEGNRCVIVVSFIPESRAVYVLRYGSDMPEGETCRATVETVVSEGGAKSARLAPSASVAYPRQLRGDAAFHPGGLCALQP